MATFEEMNPDSTKTDGHCERRALGLPDTEATPQDFVASTVFCSAAFEGVADDPNLITLEEQQANLAADAEAYKALTADADPAETPATESVN